MTQQDEISGNALKRKAHRNAAELNTWTKQRHEAALEPDLPIIDTHHHLWENENGRYLLNEFVEDISTGHNIIASVFMENGWMQPVEEVKFINSIATMSASGAYGKSRVCAGIVGTADLTLGDRVQPLLERLVEEGNGRFRGIRFGTAWDGTDSAAKFGRRNTPRHQLLDPTLRKGLARLQALGLSFDAWMFYPQLPELADLLRAFPNTNVILGHAGGLLRMPHGTSSEEFEIWRKNIHELSRFPNLSIKAGGVGMLHCGWDFHTRELPPSSEELAAAWRPYVEVCIDAFGVDRCVVESNFPADKVTCGYGVLWNAMKRITQEFSAAEKAALYHDSAARVYRLAV